MKTFYLIILASLLPLTVLAEVAPAVPSAYRSVQPGLEVSARPGQAEGTFEIAAVVSDSASGEVLARPGMTVRAGQWARVSIDREAMPGDALVFSATVDPSGQVSAFLAEVTQAGAGRQTFSGTVLVAP